MKDTNQKKRRENANKDKEKKHEFVVCINVIKTFLNGNKGPDSLHIEC